MLEYWEKSLTAFSDCRLETYYKIFNQLTGQEISKENFFIMLEPINENIIKFKMNFKEINFDLFSCEQFSKNINNNLINNFKFDINDIFFDNILKEVEWIKNNIQDDSYIVIELVTNYLNKTNYDIDKVKLTNISTTTILGYDECSNEFILGLKNVKTNKLITISVNNYIKARTQKIYPFSPYKGISIFKIKEKIHFINTSLIEHHLINQFIIIRDDIIKNNLLELLSESNNSLAAFYDNKYIEDVISLQKGFLYISMAKSNTSGYMYEISDVIKKNKILSNNEIEKIELLGRNYKKTTRMLRFPKNNKEIFLDFQFKESYKRYLNDKFNVIEYIISTFNKNY